MLCLLGMLNASIYIYIYLDVHQADLDWGLIDWPVPAA